MTKNDQYNFLKMYYPESNILLINRQYCSIESSPIDDYKIYELIYGDRVFSYDIKNGSKFLTNIQKPIYDFISRNNIWRENLGT